MRNRLNRAVALLPLLVAAPLAAQSFADAPEPVRAGFGTAVAVGDREVFVGEGANVLRPGTVYIYRPDGSGWSESHQLTAPRAERGDGFGRSVAASRDMLLVGEVGDDGRSRVHLFQKGQTRWRHTGELVAEAAGEGSGFGSSLAMSGPVAVIGAPGSDERPGRIYLYEWTPRRGWQLETSIAASDSAAGDGFGSSLAIDGDRIIVGAPARGESAGGAYIIRQDPGTGDWAEEALLEGADMGRRSGFGAGVALFRTRALVTAPGANRGTGTVIEFERDPATYEWQEVRRLMPFDAGRSTRFGSALVYRDGVAYIGAPGAGEAGAIYVYRSAGEGEWVSAEKLVARDLPADAGFGASLAMAGDVAVAGATGEDFGAGSAVILAQDGGLWRMASKVESEPESLEAVTGGEVRCEGGEAAIFDCADVDLLSFLPVSELGGERGVEVNDIWGWVDPETGNEYALVGRMDGTSFVDISDPSNPRYLGDLPKTEGSNAAVWRDIKVYDDHAFIVADGAGQHGMQVFDLTRLRNVNRPVTFDVDAYYDRIASAHNIVMDTASGFAFAVGARSGGETCGGGLHMIDVRDPTNPSFAGCFADPQTGRASTGYSHDAQCVTYEGPDADYSGRQICLGANETALSIADVTDKANPVALARASYPNVGYTHQGWLTPDQQYFYMNDELDELQGKVSRTRTLIWDVSDLDDPQLVGEFMGATEATDHNLYIRGNTMYQSNYEAGLRIIDITDPTNPREVGHFDTVPYGENTPGFDGSWSNYPFFPSGTIVVTSGREGLFVLRKRGPVS